MNAPLNTNFHLSLPAYSQLLCQYDPQHRALWYYMNPEPRSCFSITLLKEIRDLQTRLAAYLRSAPEAGEQIQYLIMASANPEAFSLGGDLKLFVDLISERNRDALYSYGQLCVDASFHNVANFGQPTTISLVQGLALGGGFEAALTTNVLIAEQGAELGFPEILFNLFPGMGAHSFLSRRINPAQADRMLHSGDQYGAQELWKMGLVDVVAPRGEGVRVVNEFIRRHSRSRNGHVGIQRARQTINPITYQELISIVDIWVDAALRLTARDLRMMTRLVSAQERLGAAEAEAEAVAA